MITEKTRELLLEIAKQGEYDTDHLVGRKVLALDILALAESLDKSLYKDGT
jgi:hypothetical protein